MKNLPLRWIFIACIICFGSLCHAQNVLQIQTQSGMVPVTHEGLQAVLWMQTSAEYHVLCSMVFNQAKKALDATLADKKWTACLEQTKDFSHLPPAVIMDIDETVLDNSPFQGEVAKKDLRNDTNLWTEWVRLQRCEGIPGALDFIKYAQSKEVTVFFITNRDHSDQEATRKNLTQLGVNVPETPETVLTKKDNDSDKSLRRATVAACHRILLLIGDDLGDFVWANDTPAERIKISKQHSDKWGTGWFLLPNPVYGSWDGSLHNFDYKLKRTEILNKKWEHLKGFKSQR